MIPKSLLLVLGVAVLVALLTAGHWYTELSPAPAIEPVRAALTLLFCAGMTMSFLLLRWLRWHFLLRRFTHAVRARDSFVLYGATLPALLTPFALGELVRVLPLRKRSPSSTKYLVLVFFLERFLDLSFVVALALAAHPELGVSVLGVAAGVLLLCHLWLTRAGPRRSLLGFAPAAFAISLVQWTTPVVALWFVLGQTEWSGPVSRVASALGAALLRGGLSGLPMGAGVTSSSLIIELTGLGLPESVAILSGALFRFGTAWVAVGTGLLLLFAFRRPVLAMFRGPVAGDHFDAIAAEYQSLIPEHVRARLLLRKVEAMTRALLEKNIGPGAKGLDVGCGQGGYASVLAKRGYVMTGVEASEGQLALARRHASESGIPVVLTHGAADALPFRDGVFDFVYMINVVHHIPGTVRRARALSECVRVLRPGGMLFLHEINTQNPLFRFYMGYVFPFLRKIDDGTEEWIWPSDLPRVEGQRWRKEIVYFTFLPEFIPQRLLHRFSALESFLERSPLRKYSAHFMASLEKAGSAPEAKP